ncbi:MAG: acyl-CoA synthetase FdrA [Alphaproteobacteria bacterium]|nr:acyl-CoA synthetase FdrA [Alphaproteobacteria bacterium]
MAVSTRIVHNLYRDSVSLMQLSDTLAKRAGIAEISAVMATPANLDLLREAKLLDGTVSAGPNDLLIVARGETAAVSAALDEAEASLMRAPATGGDGTGPAEKKLPHSLAAAVAERPSANLVLISTPGEYAAAEARKALNLGLNVMVFSDNVGLASEIALKRLADERGLLVMGPDCGTAIISGVPLGFANVVRRGAIGVVGASGTGTQQVTCLVDRLGAGISHAIGTGGRDLHHHIGGASMLRGLALLAADQETKVIVLVSKPPAPEVMEKVLAAAAKAGKPVVVNFLGADPAAIKGRNLYAAATLEDAAHAAVSLLKGRKSRPVTRIPAVPRVAFKKGQRYVRGLYSGGTFGYEASLLLGAKLGAIRSNVAVRESDEHDDPWTSRGHTIVDLGDDVFTRGRPHPMIDHRLRNERLAKEAADPETAVILLDVVLGHGAHADPAAAMTPAIREAHETARRAGRRLAIVGFVCGTPGDPQGLKRQEDALRKAGMTLCASNAEAVRLVARLLPRDKAPARKKSKATKGRRR